MHAIRWRNRRIRRDISSENALIPDSLLPAAAFGEGLRGSGGSREVYSPTASEQMWGGGVQSFPLPDWVRKIDYSSTRRASCASRGSSAKPFSELFDTTSPVPWSSFLVRYRRYHDQLGHNSVQQAVWEMAEDFPPDATPDGYCGIRIFGDKGDFFKFLRH